MEYLCLSFKLCLLVALSRLQYIVHTYMQKSFRLRHGLLERFNFAHLRFQGEFKGVFYSNIYFQMFLVRFESAFLGLMN